MPQYAEGPDGNVRLTGRPGSPTAYRAEELAYELGRTAREQRQQRSWSRAVLGRAPGAGRSDAATAGTA